MRKNITRLILALAFCLALIPITASAATESGQETNLIAYQAIADDTTTRIYAQSVDSVYYLFLPSSADYEALPLSVPAEATLTGTVSGQSLTIAGTQTVNLTTLFGDMVSGTQYPLKVTMEDVTTTVNVMRSANLPSLYITLKNGADVDFLNASKENSASGTLTMINADGTAVKGAQATGLKKIKGRGNSTWYAETSKKPYNITLSDKAELISGAGKSKKWCLLANNITDLSGICNTIAYNTYQAVDGASALSTQSVDLYINGDYRGTYFLTEKVEVDSKRVDITETVNEDDETSVVRVIQPGGVTTTSTPNWTALPGESATVHIETAEEDDAAILAGVQAYQYAKDSTQETEGGFLLELDQWFNSEASWFVTRRGLAFTVKTPEFATKEQVQKIAIYVQEFEDALYSDSGYNAQGKYWGDYVDVESLAKMYLLDAFTLQGDMMSSSAFFYTDLGENGQLGQIFTGPAWDYNWIEIAYRDDFLPWEINYYDWRGNTIWTSQLLTKGEFVAELNKLNETVYRPVWDELISNGGLQSYIDELAVSQSLNAVRWREYFKQISASSFSTDATTYTEAFSRRYNTWYNTLWTNEKLLGVTAGTTTDTQTVKIGDTLSANISGTANAYQWYKIGDDSQPIAISGATSQTYTPTEAGTYYVAVTGKNIGFNQYVKDNIELYTVDGVPSLLADEYITMTSNAVSVASVEIPVVPGTPEVPETPEITETPEAPETPESPETPETPETPEISETPSTTETPTTSGNATGSTSGGSSGGGGSAAKPSNTMSGSASEVSVSISAAEAKKAAESGATITIPMDSLSASADTANAPTVTLSIPAEAGTVKVKIPVENATLGTVAVLVKEDGTEEIIKTTVLSDNGILVNLSGDVTVKIIDNTPDFQDVSSENPSWYRDAVNFVAARGIMSGTDANSFQPDENLSRGMIAQMLFSLENKPATSTEKSFSDVGGAWYTDAVLWAAEMGVVSGYPDGSFGANDNMTREQMAVILYGYSKMKGYDLSTDGDVSSFTDGAETSAWAKDAVEWAVGIGLMSGKDGGILDPRGTASRAEVATVFMNYCQNVAQ